jgi:hypothetical protein
MEAVLGPATAAQATEYPAIKLIVAAALFAAPLFSQ